METRERRFIPIKEIRAIEGDNGEMIIEGYPIVFNSPTTIWDFREVILPGAATKALTRSEEFVLWNHNDDKPMARRTNGTLEAKEDEKGVYIRADVSGTQWGRDGYEAIKSGVIDQMSFAFSIPEGGERWTTEDMGGVAVPLREIIEFGEIYDYSPVTYPAYKNTSVSARGKEIATRNMPEPPSGEEGSSSDEFQVSLKFRKRQLKIKQRRSK